MIKHIKQKLEKNKTGNFEIILTHSNTILPISRNHLKKIKSKFRIDSK